MLKEEVLRYKRGQLLICHEKSKSTQYPSSTTFVSGKRKLRGSKDFSGVHAAEIFAKKNCLNQYQVVNCRVHEGDVIGNLAKS